MTLPAWVPALQAEPTRPLQEAHLKLLMDIRAMAHVKTNAPKGAAGKRTRAAKAGDAGHQLVSLPDKRPYKPRRQAPTGEGTAGDTAAEEATAGDGNEEEDDEDEEEELEDDDDDDDGERSQGPASSPPPDSGADTNVDQPALHEPRVTRGLRR